VITPGQAIVAQNTVAASAVPTSVRRWRRSIGRPSSRSVASQISATAASEIGQPTRISTRAEPPVTPEPVTL